MQDKSFGIRVLRREEVGDWVLAHTHLLRDSIGQVVWADFVCHCVLGHSVQLNVNTFLEARYEQATSTVLYRLAMNELRKKQRIRPFQATLLLAQGMADLAAERFAEQNHMTLDQAKGFLMVLCLSGMAQLVTSQGELEFEEWRRDSLYKRLRKVRDPYATIRTYNALARKKDAANANATSTDPGQA